MSLNKETKTRPNQDVDTIWVHKCIIMIILDFIMSDKKFEVIVMGLNIDVWYSSLNIFANYSAVIPFEPYLKMFG